MGKFIIIDTEIEAAMYDVNILVEAMESEHIHEDARNFIIDELDKALNLLSMTKSRTRYI